jgi:hypothetical protein
MQQRRSGLVALLLIGGLAAALAQGTAQVCSANRPAANLREALERPEGSSVLCTS